MASFLKLSYINASKKNSSIFYLCLKKALIPQKDSKSEKRKSAIVELKGMLVMRPIAVTFSFQVRV